MMVGLLSLTLLSKFQVVEIIEVFFYDHGVALDPLFGIAFPFQIIAPGICGIGEIHLFCIHMIYKQGLLCIQGLVGFLDPGRDLPDAVAGKEQKNSRNNKTMHSCGCMAQLN
jgi:hypothetical protein